MTDAEKLKEIGSLLNELREESGVHRVSAEDIDGGYRVQFEVLDGPDKIEMTDDERMVLENLWGANHIANDGNGIIYAGFAIRELVELVGISEERAERIVEGRCELDHGREGDGIEIIGFDWVEDEMQLTKNDLSHLRE